MTFAGLNEFHHWFCMRSDRTKPIELRDIYEVLQKLKQITIATAIENDKY